MSLYKFTHISLFTNNAQLKQNKVKKAKRENERVIHLNLFKNSCHEKKKKGYGKVSQGKEPTLPTPREIKRKNGKRQSVQKSKRKENK